MSKAGFKYYAGTHPPAPFVNLTAAAPGAAATGLRVRAQIDTGAFMTVIPLALATQAGLLQVRELPVEGLGGAVFLFPTFLVEFAIDGLSPVTVEVMASPNEPDILLGRDVLNRYQIELDGPAQELTVTEP
jgi:predicted aspartyl protease